MTHPDAHLFKRPSVGAMVRQSIWGLLMKSPDQSFNLAELSKATEYTYSLIHQAARMLVRKGLAERVGTADIPSPTKKDPERKKQVAVIKVIEPWKPSKKGSWDA